MKRIDILTDYYLDLYLMQAENYKRAHYNKGWTPLVFFDDLEFNLQKLSLRIPKSWVKKDGTVSTARLIPKLRAKIRSRVVGALGYITFYDKSDNTFIVWCKRDTPTYYRHEWRQDLKMLT